ncbi:uncharacterized protein LOC136074605 [Hydra vulgaris]|uniref:Uncharacterized protein LOC136074605 n=1 Tax=Hydra vulgaris TaxID=6087 RepID=A0ABM4B2I6_HYDVU
MILKLISTSRFWTSLYCRFQQLQQHNEDFKIIHNLNQLKQWDNEDLLKHCKNLHIKLTDDANLNDEDIDGIALNEDLKTIQFFIKSNLSPHEVLNYIYKNALNEIFPNITIVLRIFLTLPVSVASGERSFSKLKLIKNYLRSTMKEERLTDLSIISIESDTLDSIDINDLIKNFVAAKARRVNM